MSAALKGAGGNLAFFKKMDQRFAIPAQLKEPLAVLALVLRRSLGDQPVHFLLGHLHAVRPADLRQQQAEPHAALSDAAILG